MSAVHRLRPRGSSSRREETSLFPPPYDPGIHAGALLDAIHAEVQFATGIEAALNGIEAVDNALMQGARELCRIHVDRLNEIGRLAEKVARS